MGGAVTMRLSIVDQIKASFAGPWWQVLLIMGVLLVLMFPIGTPIIFSWRRQAPADTAKLQRRATTTTMSGWCRGPTKRVGRVIEVGVRGKKRSERRTRWPLGLASSSSNSPKTKASAACAVPPPRAPPPQVAPVVTRRSVLSRSIFTRTPMLQEMDRQVRPVATVASTIGLAMQEGSRFGLELRGEGAGPCHTRLTHPHQQRPHRRGVPQLAIPR